MNAKFTNKTRQQAKQCKMGKISTTSNFRFESNKIQHQFSIDVLQTLKRRRVSTGSLRSQNNKQEK